MRGGFEHIAFTKPTVDLYTDSKDKRQKKRRARFWYDKNITLPSIKSLALCFASLLQCICMLNLVIASRRIAVLRGILMCETLLNKCEAYLLYFLHEFKASFVAFLPLYVINASFGVVFATADCCLKM